MSAIQYAGMSALLVLIVYGLASVGKDICLRLDRIIKLLEDRTR